MVKKLKKSQYILLVLLAVSILVNISCIIDIFKYKYEIGQQSYTIVEEIRQRNESSLDILDKSIDNGYIKNEELLKLYKNYDVITSGTIDLWQQYNSYTQNSSALFSKKIETNKAIENDIHGKAKEYLLSTLNKEMKNEESEFKLGKQDLKCFEEMRNMSQEIYNFYNEFYGEKLNNLSGPMKEKKIISKHYWIDILNKLCDISGKYVDINWNMEMSEVYE